MKLKNLFTPLFLVAVLLTGCSTTPENQPEDRETIEEQREALAYEWFEKKTGLSSNDLIPPKKSIMARDYIYNLNAWYEPQVEARIKSSLKLLYESIPDVNYDFRYQMVPKGVCLPPRLIKRAVKEALPFLITREKGTGPFRELMRQVINMVLEGRYAPIHLADNPYALREVQMEYYYRAAVKLAYVMHNPQYASNRTSGNYVSCAKLESLLSPMVLAGAAKEWSKTEAVNSLKKEFGSAFKKVIAFHETSDRLYFILSSHTVDEAIVPLYKPKSGRLYSLQCNEIKPKDFGDIEDQFEVHGDHEYWLNKFAQEEYGLNKKQTEDIMHVVNLSRTYKPVNGYRYLTENIPSTFERWRYNRPEVTQLVRVEECWIPKRLLQN